MESIYDVKKANIHPGSKFFRYSDTDEEPEIIRIKDIDKEKNKIKYFDSKWKTLSMDYKELSDNYKMLRADGMIMFSIVKVGDLRDVIVALKGFNMDKKFDDSLPYAICRQSISDFFSNMHNKINQIFTAGVSVSQNTCPANIDFRLMAICDSVEYSRAVAIYLDDSLQDILRFIRMKKFDDVLVSLKTSSIKRIRENSGLIAVGYCDTIKELLTANNFMYDFRQCFNIIEVPFHIDGNLDELDMKNVLFLEKEFNANIMETYMIKYTREIDLKTIKRDYVLITSAEDDYKDIYILGYDKADGDYVPRALV